MGAELLDDDLAGAARLDPRDVDLAVAREVTYALRNDVAYEYPAPIRASHHRLVILPRLRHRDQLRLAHRLAVDAPSPTAVRRRCDTFGPGEYPPLPGQTPETCVCRGGREALGDGRSRTCR
jgi:hypothetical protein